MACVAAMSHGIEPDRRTRAVVLTGAGSRANQTSAIFVRVATVLTHPRVLRRRKLGLLVVRAMAGGPGVDRELLEAVRAEFLRFDRRTLAENDRMVLALDVTARLPSVTLPVHVVAGQRDRITPVAAQRALAALIPRSQFTVLPGGGHQLMFDAPDELSRVIGQVARFREEG